MKQLRFKKWFLIGLGVLGVGGLISAISLTTVKKATPEHQKVINNANTTKMNQFALTPNNTMPYVSDNQILQDLNYNSNTNMNNYFTPLGPQNADVQYPLATTKFNLNVEANDISTLNSSIQNATSIVSTAQVPTDIPLLTFANNPLKNENWNQLATKLISASGINSDFSNIAKWQWSQPSSWASQPYGWEGSSTSYLLPNAWGWSNTHMYGTMYSMASYGNGPFLAGPQNPINNDVLNAPNNLQNENWTFQASNGNSSNTQCSGIVTNNNTPSPLAEQLETYFTDASSTSDLNYSANFSSGNNFAISLGQHNWEEQMAQNVNDPNVSININFANTWASAWQFYMNLFLFNNTYKNMQASTTLSSANDNNGNYNSGLANTLISDFYNTSTYPTNSQTFFLNPSYTVNPVILGNQQTTTLFNQINVNLANLLVVNTNSTTPFYNSNDNNNSSGFGAWSNPNLVLLQLGWNTKLMNAIYEASQIAQSLNKFLNENPSWKDFSNTNVSDALSTLCSAILSGKVNYDALQGWINDVKQNPNNFSHFTYTNQNGQVQNVVASTTMPYWNTLVANNINLNANNGNGNNLATQIQDIFNWNTLWSYLIKQTFNQDIYVSWSPSNDPSKTYTSCVYSPQNGWSAINANSQLQVSATNNQIALGINVKKIWFQYPQALASTNTDLIKDANEGLATIDDGQDGLSIQNIYHETQVVNKEYANNPLAPITNNLWDAQNSLVALNSQNQINPIVYLNNENDEINYLVSFQNALQAQKNYLPKNGTSLAILNNFPYYNGEIIGVNMQYILKEKLSEALGVPYQLLKQQGLSKTFLNNVSYLNSSILETSIPTMETINQKANNGAYKYPQLNNFYNLWNNYSTSIPSKNNYYTEKAYNEALNKYWEHVKSIDNLDYYYCYVSSPINLLDYLSPSNYASLINQQFLIPTFSIPSKNQYNYFMEVSSAYKPLNLVAQNNTMVNNVNSANADNVMMNLNQNVIINTSDLQTNTINSLSSQINTLKTRIQSQEVELNNALSGGLSNINNGLNTAYNKMMDDIHLYLATSGNLVEFEQSFDKFMNNMKLQLFKIADNYQKVKSANENTWHGIYIGKKFSFNYKNELMQMQDLINNASSTFENALKKQGQWEALQKIIQNDYLDYVNNLSQVFSSFSNNLSQLQTLNQQLNTILNTPISVMQGSVINFNLANWASVANNPQLTLDIENPSSWATKFFNVSQNAWLSNINNWLKDNGSKIVLNSADLENTSGISNTNQTLKWFFNWKTHMAILVVGKAYQYNLIVADKVNPIDLNNYQSVNMSDGTINATNTELSNLNALNEAVIIGFKTTDISTNLFKQWSSFAKQIAPYFKNTSVNKNAVKLASTTNATSQNVNNKLSQRTNNIILNSIMNDQQINNTQMIMNGANPNDFPPPLEPMLNSLKANSQMDANIINNAVNNYANYDGNLQRLNWIAIGLIIAVVIISLILTAGLTYRYVSSRQVNPKKHFISDEDKAEIDAQFKDGE